ncbi:hypothetical protein ACNVED_02215 [Legionella sp. D16C41]|uniref:hypothetical protein n=1 Tax=Legionella sp. D16C41 TaxID=3402688 RepID=UPI003AF70FBA
MNRSLLKFYKDWLNSYCKRNPSATVNIVVARKLINDLDKVQTLKEASALFFAIIEEKSRADSNLTKGFLSLCQNKTKGLLSLFQNKTSSRENKTSSIEDIFYKNITIWHAQAEKMLSMIDKVEEKVGTLIPYAGIEPIITLLNEILSRKEDLLLNDKGGSLLNLLNTADLKEMLNYLVSLSVNEQALAPQTSIGLFSSKNEHSFTYEQPIDNLHAECQKLFKVVTSNCSPENKNWENLNSLFQTAIPIYKDIKASLEVEASKTQEI